MKRAVLVLGLFILMLTSCNDVPEDVKSRAEEREKAKSAAQNKISEAKIEHISPSDMEVDIKKALSESYSNLILADSIKVELPSEYTLCDFTQADGMDANAQKLADRFFTKDELDGETIAILNEPATDGDDDPNMIYAKGFRDETKQLHCFSWDNGFCCLMKHSFFVDMGTDWKLCKLYHVDRGDDLSDKYQLEDGEMSVKEAVELAKEWIDKNYSDIEPDYNFKVKTVIAKENDFGEKQFYIKVAKSYKDIFLDELCEVVDSSEPDPVKGGMYARIENSLNYIEIQIRQKGEIGYFANSIGTVIPKENGKLDKVVSLSSALRFIQYKFADLNEPLKIGDIGLKYMLSPKYDYKAYKFYNNAGTELKGKIVWEFVIDVPQEIGSRCNDVRKYIYIDAENGEMMFNFDVNTLIQ